MNKIIYVGCLEGSGKVYLDESNVVVDAMPVFNKFIGQPIVALIRWAQAKGGYSMERERGT